MAFSGKQDIQRALERLNAKMVYAGMGSLELVSCGGASLNLMGWVSRSTADVDIICSFQVDPAGGPSLVKTTELPGEFRTLIAEVGRDLGLDETWLNFGPAPLMDFGLPPGLETRLQRVSFGKALALHLVGRLDQIHLKLYAVMDPKTRIETHLGDLMDLEPTENETRQAVNWLLNRKTSADFRKKLKQILDRIGHEKLAKGI